MPENGTDSARATYKSGYVYVNIHECDHTGVQIILRLRMSLKSDWSSDYFEAARVT